MRKLTGYIGAMIIVFALAGSIMAGYALNINGTSTVINEYEKVTDVSGLYAHSDEKTYIEYNPASNYVNYSANPVTYTNTGVSTYKLIKGVNWHNVKDGDITNVGVQHTDGNTLIKYRGENTSRYQGSPSVYLANSFLCDYFFVEVAGGSVYFNDYYNKTGTVLTEMLDISTLDHDGEMWVYLNGTTVKYPFPSVMIVYCTESDYDYLQMYNAVGVYAYLQNRNDLLSVAKIIDNGDTINCVTIGDNIVSHSSWGNVPSKIPNFNQAYPQLDNGLFYGDVSFNITSDGKQYQPYGSFYPRYATSTRGLGIDYTESSRVNNYLMEQQNITTDITTGTLKLSDVGDNNYFYYNSFGYKQIGIGQVMYSSNRELNGVYNIPIQYPSLTIYIPGCLPESTISYNYNNLIWNYDGFHNVKLSTVLQSFSIPQGTTSIKITTNSSDYYTYDNGVVSATLDKNLVYFSYLPNMIKDNGTTPSLNSEKDKKDYLVYDLTSNMCTVYTCEGVARYSGTPDDISIFYYEDDETNKAFYAYQRDRDSSQNQGFLTNITNRPTPFITLEITQTTGGVMKYADITKGYSIKPDNDGPITWNNTYENGDIKVLFRANDTGGAYSNTLTVANNNISINYTNNRFSVSLNSGSPVDIGTWRNIVLDIDLINGKLYAIPVRTFNSFTNVTMDNTNILIGDLVGAAPTNSIVWGMTTNSFLFNVYSTDVFMNTYGVVMVNPTLDITHFFTDLNQFYRLKMYNFAIYGDSMTINGETLAVTDGKVTYDDMTLELKDFNVTYADGMVTIGDNHGIIELGEITTTNISMDGNWYFITDLERGYTAQKTIYDWDWGTFIFDNTQFCVFYLGIMAAALIVARKYCNLSIIDYMVLVASIVIALGVQVVA